MKLKYKTIEKILKLYPIMDILDFKQLALVSIN